MGRLLRGILFVHRWLGVALCLIFLLWFFSGIGMMYWTFPSVGSSDRLSRSPALVASTIRRSPAEAYAALGASEAPRQVHLNAFDGRPVYRFRQEHGESVIYADTGEEQIEVSPDLMRRVAATWTGQPAGNATVEPLTDVDQWTVNGVFRSASPIWKYSWPNGEQVYVSETSGDVVQYTTSASRLGAYLGPIPHWVYFTPLRKRTAQWSRFVIWSSGISTITATLGMVIGIWMYSPSRRYRFAGTPTSIPYQGWKRWHMVAGLWFGVGAVTWAFSGMLSMDPFPTPTSSGAGGPQADAIESALRGRIDLAAFEQFPPHSALASIAARGVKGLEFANIGGRPVYIATLEDRSRRVIPADGRAGSVLDAQQIADLVAPAVSPHRADVSVVAQYDRYCRDRHGESPLPVVLVDVDDTEDSRYYIDPTTARIVESYASRDWVTRWLYHGLHSLDFPWLYNYRPAWDLVVLTFMLGGSALCVTSLMLAWRAVTGAVRR